MARAAAATASTFAVSSEGLISALPSIAMAAPAPSTPVPKTVSDAPAPAPAPATPTSSDKPRKQRKRAERKRTSSTKAKAAPAKQFANTPLLASGLLTALLDAKLKDFSARVGGNPTIMPTNKAAFKLLMSACCAEIKTMLQKKGVHVIPAMLVSGNTRVMLKHLAFAATSADMVSQ